MASGRTHFLLEAAVGMAAAGAMFSPEIRDSVARAMPLGAALGFIAGYLFSLFFLSPDLDLHRSMAKRAWGPLGFIWKPYDWLFDHRGFSHSLLFGTATRLLYLFIMIGLPALAVLWRFDVIAPETWTLEDIHPWLPAVAGFIAGAYVPDMIHVLVDKLKLA